MKYLIEDMKKEVYKELDKVKVRIIDMEKILKIRWKK